MSILQYPTLKEKIKNRTKLHFGFIIQAGLLDAVTTLYALQYTGAVEINPLVNILFHAETYVVMTLVLVSLAFVRYFSVYLFYRKGIVTRMESAMIYMTLYSLPLFNLAGILIVKLS